MNFAGKYAYVSRADDDNDEELNVAEDELQHSSLAEAGLVDGAPRSMAAAPMANAAPGGGLFSSFVNMFKPGPSSAGAPPPPPAPQPAAAAAGSVHKDSAEESKKEKKRVYRRQADTNVVALQFSTLANKADENVFAGDPVYCGNAQCRAALSFTSKPFNRKKKPAPNSDEKSPEPFASVTIVPKAPASDDVPLMAPAPESLSSLATIPEGTLSSLSIPSESLSPSVNNNSNEPFHVQIDNVDADEEETVWCCEYCGHENIVVLTPEEVPSTESRDYILEPASDSKSASNAEAGNVIFVVDVSGSMCVTTEVPGRFKLKGSAARAASAFDIPAEAGFVNAPVARSHTTTHVSRLQCVQAAIDQQIEDWKKSQPNRQVGLVTFNREVSVFGDGTNPPEIITGDKLSNQAALQEIGSRLTISKPVSQSADTLSKHLWDLEEGGPTALGPALLVAVSMASKTNGSRVVVCTDGLANVGLGALDKNSCPTDAARQQAEQWYESVGHLAKLSGVLVSVISIKGEECALEDLGKVAEITGGDVNRVDPQELQKNFNSLLAKPVIATQVTATILMHKGLVFRNEDQATSRLVREVGNVNEDTEITFEYGLRSDDVLKEFDQLKSLPFQVQITFTKIDGMKCLRVLSKSQPITRDRNEAEADVQMDVLAANVQQQTAKLAEKGDLLNARVNNLAWGKYLHKHSSRNTVNSNVYNQWVQEADSHHSSLSVQQAAVSSMGPAPAGSSARMAKAVRGDAGYQEQHRAKTKSSSAYRKIS